MVVPSCPEQRGWRGAGGGGGGGQERGRVSETGESRENTSKEYDRNSQRKNKRKKTKWFRSLKAVKN